MARGRLRRRRCLLWLFLSFWLGWPWGRRRGGRRPIDGAVVTVQISGEMASKVNKALWKSKLSHFQEICCPKGHRINFEFAPRISHFFHVETNNVKETLCQDGDRLGSPHSGKRHPVALHNLFMRWGPDNSDRGPNDNQRILPRIFVFGCQ